MFGFHGTNVHGFFTEQIVDDIDIMRCLLQEKPLRSGFISIPVVEINKSIGNIVERLYMLNLANRAGIQNTLDLLHQRCNA
ncbi:hypothetical protein D3C76_1415140 [compost metagenome]